MNASTPIGRAKIMQKVVTACEEGLGYLYGRWLDEKAYEDFEDYAKQMKTICEKIPGAVFIQANKRPFGFIAQIKDFPYRCQISMSNSVYQWKSVKN